MRIDWTEEKIEKARALRLELMPWKEVAAVFGCGVEAVKYAVSPMRRRRRLEMLKRIRDRKIAARPKLFPYVGQFDPDTGRQSW